MVSRPTQPKHRTSRVHAKASGEHGRTGLKCSDVASAPSGDVAVELDRIVEGCAHTTHHEHHSPINVLGGGQAAKPMPPTEMGEACCLARTQNQLWHCRLCHRGTTTNATAAKQRTARVHAKATGDVDVLDASVVTLPVLQAERSPLNALALRKAARTQRTIIITLRWSGREAHVAKRESPLQLCRTRLDHMHATMTPRPTQRSTEMQGHGEWGMWTHWFEVS